MKVFIGPYRGRVTNNLHSRYMNRKYQFDWPDKQTYFESFLEGFNDGIQFIYDITINKVLELIQHENQKINVQIDYWDTWSMDHTLAHIIVPMLKQLNETKHGAPFVDDQDVPEELRSTSAPPKENNYDVDANHFKRWDWVLQEMVWAFEQKARDDWEGDYYQYEHFEPKNEGSIRDKLGLRLVWEDPEGRKAHQERMSNGFRLFGKYYEELWD
jgi:hypothetical protein